MQAENEVTVWRRIYGGSVSETLPQRMERLAGQEQQGACLLLHLAGLCPTDAARLRALAHEKSRNAALLTAVFFLETGKRLLLPPPRLPLAGSVPELLAQQHRNAQAAAEDYQRKTDAYAEVFDTLLQNARREGGAMRELLAQRL